MGTHDNKNLSIYFVLPQDQSLIDGNEFINRFKNDPNIVRILENQKSYNVTFLPLKTEKELEEKNINDRLNEILAAIVFNNDYTDYTIRIKGNDIVNSKEKAVLDYAKSRKFETIKEKRIITRFDGEEFYSYIQSNEINNYNYYNILGYDIYYKDNTMAGTYEDTFIPIQVTIDNIIIQLITNGTVNGYTANVGKLSKPEVSYIIDEKQNQKRSFNGYAGFSYILFIGPMIHLAFKIMNENETGIRDGLISIGGYRIVTWLSWIIIYFPFVIISILGVMIIDPSHILQSINKFMFFIIYLVYGITIMEMTVIICLLNKKTKNVIFVIGFSTLIILVLNGFLYKLKCTNFVIIEKFFSSLFTSIGISMMSSEITFEYNRKGYISVFDCVMGRISSYFWFMILDIFLYFFIAAFIDYYSYDLSIQTFGVISRRTDDTESHALDIQEDPLDSECFVQVRNIYKYFMFKKKYLKDNNNNNDGFIDIMFTVNKNISFNAYKDEIFAILGHNGAGKSTLIKIMVGLLRPEFGEIYYNGLPITKNKNVVQYFIGLCLENNVLIEEFTVAEHYYLYSGIKETYHELDTWLKDVDLCDKKIVKFNF